MQVAWRGQHGAKDSRGAGARTGERSAGRSMNSQKPAPLSCDVHGLACLSAASWRAQLPHRDSRVARTRSAVASLIDGGSRPPTNQRQGVAPAALRCLRQVLRINHLAHGGIKNAPWGEIS